MKRKGIKNLLIDFGGVLINLDRPRCIENFKKLGLQNVDELLNVYHQQGIFMQQEKGLVTSAEFRDVIRQMVGKPLTDQQIDDAAGICPPLDGILFIFSHGGDAVIHLMIGLFYCDFQVF